LSSWVPERVDCAFEYVSYLWVLTALAPVFLVLQAVFNASKFTDVIHTIGKLYYLLYFGIIEVLLTGRDLDDVYEASKNRGERP